MTVDSQESPASSSTDVESTQRRRQLPGEILAIAAVAPAVVAAAWVAGALLLLALHAYRPLPATVLGLGLAIFLLRPTVTLARASARRASSSRAEVPWWVLVAVAVIVAAFGVLAYAHSAQDVLVRRDPGSYAMSGDWLAQHGTIDMADHPQLWGAPNPHLILASQGFYRDGSHDIPQFMTGVPVLLAIGGWIAGLTGVLHVNAFIGAFGLLAFAGVSIRLIGARWTPLAVLVLALAQPDLDVIRATYSEPSAQLILLGGLAIVLDALVVGALLPKRATQADDAAAAGSFADDAAGSFADDAPGSFADDAAGSFADDDLADAAPSLSPKLVGRALFVGGLVLGLVSVVRIDAVADLLPTVPFLGWLAFHRVPAWRRLAWGIAVGLAFGAFDCLVLTLPYTEHVGSDLLKVGIGFGLVVPATMFAVRWARRRRADSSQPNEWAAPSASAPRSPWTRVRNQQIAATACVFLIGLFFFLRPHLMTMRSKATSGGANYVGQVQRYQHMAFDPTRSYYENATIWVSWYVGWGTLALALGGACWLAFEQVAGRRRVWALAFLVFFGMAVAVLFEPSITPDHPWADRRFVPVVLPGLLLFAFVAVAAVARKLNGYPWSGSTKQVALRMAAPAFLVAAIAVIVLPTWFGSRQVLFSQTEVGEPGLVKKVCAQLRPTDVVLAIGNRAKSEWPGTLRVMCGVNAGYLDGYDDPAGIATIAAQTKADGGRLMLLAESTADKDAALGLADWPAKPTGELLTSEATHTLVERPEKPAPFTTQMWLGQYIPGAS